MPASVAQSIYVQAVLNRPGKVGDSILHIGESNGYFGERENRRSRRAGRRPPGLCASPADSRVRMHQSALTSS